jgi:hypothetical protein
MNKVTIIEILKGQLDRNNGHSEKKHASARPGTSTEKIRLFDDDLKFVKGCFRCRILREISRHEEKHK